MQVNKPKKSNPQMGQSLSDFSALKFLRKELKDREKKIAPGKPSAPRRDRTVVYPGKEEARARNIGIQKGQKVRMLDSEESGRIVGFGKNFFEMESDEGYILKVRREEFILVNVEDDKALCRSMLLESKTKKEEISALSHSGEMSVDLHFDRIPGNERVAEWAARDFQIDYFRRVLRTNLKFKGKRIIFIHGDGDGVLKAAIRKELDEVFALSCSYLPAPSEQYGTGATIVVIR